MRKRRHAGLRRTPWQQALWQRAAYRVRQFFRALLAYLRPLDDHEMERARQALPEAEWALFRAMPRNDQRHSLSVYRALLAAGHDERALLQAALLHDVGKSGSRITLLHRVAIVLLKQFRPSLLTGWACGGAPPVTHWRYPFWAHAHHPEIGAARAAAAGCEPDAVTLIRHHQERLPAQIEGSAVRWLPALQAADEDN